MRGLGADSGLGNVRDGVADGGMLSGRWAQISSLVSAQVVTSQVGVITVVQC